MLAAGLMQPAGLVKVEQAKADGSWNVLDGVEDLELPGDLRAALASYADASTHFDAFPRSVKRGILEWILVARRPATRAHRIAETARLASQNIRANQWSPKRDGRWPNWASSTSTRSGAPRHCRCDLLHSWRSIRTRWSR
jgi:Bacteriocin-protection, YdeI or OmpD-Associated